MARPGRKEQVLDAAVMLFSRKGYHGTTVRDIAEEAGMLSGSLYAHIASKEDLLYEIVLGAADRFMAALRPIADGPGTATERLRQAMIAHIGVIASSRDASIVFMHEWQALSAERRAVAACRRDDHEALFAQIIRQGVESGEFYATLDQKFARLLVLSAVNWVYTWYDPLGPLAPEALADRFATLVLDGLTHRGGGIT